MTNEQLKHVTEVIAELKDELKDFLDTRLAILRSEVGEKWERIAAGGAVLLVGVLLLCTAWLVFTGFLVTIIAWAFVPSPWAYTLSFVLVTALYGIVGGVAAYLGWQRIKETNMKPERTIQVLQQDRIWLQTEAKTQL